MSPTLIQNQDGLFETTGGPVHFKDVILGVREALSAKIKAQFQITNPNDARDYFYTHLVDEEREVFSVLYLDNANQ